VMPVAEAVLVPPPFELPPPHAATSTRATTNDLENREPMSHLPRNWDNE
jgi:hypothetical protein